jgi:hypothetical protein
MTKPVLLVFLICLLVANIIIIIGLIINKDKNIYLRCIFAFGLINIICLYMSFDAISSRTISGNTNNLLIEFATITVLWLVGLFFVIKSDR